jgi:kynureninase
MCVSRMVSDVAIIVLPVVVYTTGQLLNVERIARAARERGIIFGLDCSHSIGAVNHAVDNWDVDFAVWCTYKYLNGGPGSSGGLFLNRRHFGIRPGLAGWFGSAKEAQFDLGSDFRPCATAGAMQIGSPNILSMAPLLGSLELFERAGMDRLRQKSLSLTRYMIDLSDQLITEYGIELVTPREDDRRGGHIALRHPEAARICKALKSLGVIPDFRPPDIVRLAPAPLYNSYLDCAGAILAIHNIMNHRLYESFPAGRELIA